jgi:hypothetical protein
VSAFLLPELRRYVARQRYSTQPRPSFVIKA